MKNFIICLISGLISSYQYYFYGNDNWIFIISFLIFIISTTIGICRIIGLEFAETLSNILSDFIPEISSDISFDSSSDSCSSCGGGD